MQTFLPYPDYRNSIRDLDSKRLGKQRVEAYQILNTLKGKSKGWINHPAVKMWRGHEDALTIYMNECIREWKRRGYRNTMKVRREKSVCHWPDWFGNPEFHAAHRSNLLRKDPSFYSRYGWKENNNINYIWPVK